MSAKMTDRLDRLVTVKADPGRGAGDRGLIQGRGM